MRGRYPTSADVRLIDAGCCHLSSAHHRSSFRLIRDIPSDRCRSTERDRLTPAFVWTCAETEVSGLTCNRQTWSMPSLGGKLKALLKAWSPSGSVSPKWDRPAPESQRQVHVSASQILPLSYLPRKHPRCYTSRWLEASKPFSFVTSFSILSPILILQF